MTSETEDLLEIFKSAVNDCSCQHDNCTNCVNEIDCIQLWDKAIEQTVARPLTYSRLREYLEQFQKLRLLNKCPERIN